MNKVIRISVLTLMAAVAMCVMTQESQAGSCRYGGGYGGNYGGYGGGFGGYSVYGGYSGNPYSYYGGRNFGGLSISYNRSNNRGFSNRGFSNRGLRSGSQYDSFRGNYRGSRNGLRR